MNLSPETRNTCDSPPAICRKTTYLKWTLAIGPFVQTEITDEFVLG